MVGPVWKSQALLSRRPTTELKRDEVEEDGLVADNSIAPTTGQTGTLDDQLTTELYINNLEDIVGGSAIISYEKEEELEGLSTTAKSVVVEDVDEREALNHFRLLATTSGYYHVVVCEEIYPNITKFLDAMNSRFDNKAIDNTRINQVSTVQ